MQQKTGIIIWIILIVLIIAGYFLFFYRSSFQVCLFGRGLCHMDVNVMCNPKTGKITAVSSSCTCGIDQEVLLHEGWVNCPEKYKEYEATLPKPNITAPKPIRTISYNSSQN